MSRSIIAVRIAATLAVLITGAEDAWPWGWRDDCDYTCYGAPYGNTEPPELYVYDHRAGPTWTGNGWAYLPIGTYYPRPPAFAAPNPPVVRRGRAWHRPFFRDW
jgi:hypothetical protein